LVFVIFDENRYSVFKLFDLSLILNGFPIKKAKVAFEKILSISDENYEGSILQKRKEIAEYHLKNNLLLKNGKTYPL
jgi:phenylacetate-CoA ligase